MATQEIAQLRTRTWSGPPGTSAAASGSVFGEWIVLRHVPRAGEVEFAQAPANTEFVTRALRNALQHHAVDPPPPALSGHARHGPKLERPHAAFLALHASVPDSSSQLVGLAVVLPRAIEAHERRSIQDAIDRWEASGCRLTMGRLGALTFTRVGVPVEGPFSPASWVAPSRHWASVTPVALDRNPGRLLSHEQAAAARARDRAEEIVANACERIGLPKPANVCVLRHPRLPGAARASVFAPYPRAAAGSGPKRVCVHVELEFEEPVAGPVLIGAGRYFGVGLCGVLE